MWRWSGFLLSALLLAACGAPQVGQPESTTGLDLTLSSQDAGRVEAACEPVLEGLMEGNTALIVPSLKDLDAMLSTVDGAGDLREHILFASDAMPAFVDTAPSDVDIAAAAPSLIELSNGLIAAGAEKYCAGIGEVAANFDTGDGVDRESISEALAVARGKWTSEGVSTYSLELSLGPMDAFEDGCGTGGSLLVQVVDDRVEKAVDRFSGCQVDSDNSDRVPLTVEDLFALVEEHLDADVIEVDFEPELGYPRMIFVQDDSGFTEMSVMTFTPGEADTLPAEEILAQLREQRKIWGDEGTSDYTITVEIGCFCPEEFRGPFEVTVVDGNVDTVTMNGEAVEPVDEAFLTVEGLFSTIEDYAYSDEITVTYTAEGYPQTIDIDPSRNTIDEELRIDVLDLTPSP